MLNSKSSRDVDIMQMVVCLFKSEANPDLRNILRIIEF